MTDRGRLTVVGTGIALGHITAQAVGALREANVTFAAVGGVVQLGFLVRTCRRVVNLGPLYEEGRPRKEIYQSMADLVMESVRTGNDTCLAVYGHPTYLVSATRLAVFKAKQEGFDARVLPAISADACLFADLNLDPMDHGYQSFDANAFLRDRKVWDPGSILVLWQIVAVGDDHHHAIYPGKRMPELVQKLAAIYSLDKEAVVYEAATLPFQSPRIEQIRIRHLVDVRLTTASTLLILPA